MIDELVNSFEKQINTYVGKQTNNATPTLNLKICVMC